MTIDPDAESPENGREFIHRIDIETRCNGDVPGWVIANGPLAGAESDEPMADALRWLITHRQVQAQLRCDALLSAVRFWYRRGQRYGHALEAALVAVSTATRAGLTDMTRVAKVACGVMMSLQDNYGGAIEAYVDALEIAIRQGDRRAQYLAWHNIAATMSLARMFADAADSFRKTLAIATALSTDDGKIAHTWANVASCATLQGDLADGKRAFERFLELAKDPVDRNEAMLSCFSVSAGVRILLLSGDLPGAQQQAERMRAFAGRAGSVRADLLVRSMEALLRAHRGEREAALAAVGELVELARGLGTETNLEHLEFAAEVARICGDVPRSVVYLAELAARLHEVQLANALRMQTVAGHLRNSGLAEDSQLRLACDSGAILESMAMLPAMRVDGNSESMFRVGRLSALIGAKCGMDAEASEALERAARLRDIGNAAVPDILLRKPEPLSEGELAILRTHATAGARIAASFTSPFAELVATIAGSHHENWDGSGYPRGLAGDAIPIEARIVAVADRFDAMTRRRTFKEPMPVADALAEWKRLAGGALDPALVDAGQQVVLALLRDHADIAAYLAEPAAQSALVVAARKVREALANT